MKEKLFSNIKMEKEALSNWMVLAKMKVAGI